MNSSWEKRAQDALKAGYQQGNEWEKLLEANLRRCFPDLVKELRNSMQAYIISMVSEARDLKKQLISEGTNGQTAQELALDFLPEKPAEEQPYPTKWELEGAQEDAIAACQQALVRHQIQRNNPSANPPAKATRPTSQPAATTTTEPTLFPPA